MLLTYLVVLRQMPDNLIRFVDECSIFEHQNRAALVRLTN